MANLKQAFIKTIPILCGYLFLGVAFGVLLRQAGFNFVWAFFASTFIYAGTAQFLLVSLLSGNAPLYLAAAMTFFINCRHIFYGVSFVERFKKMGKYCLYMIFSLTDETYSLLCLYKDKEADENNDKIIFYIALLNQIYWITGSVLGSLAKQYIPLDFSGIEFSMTALFLVIFIDQQKNAKTHFPALWGLVSALVCLFAFGSDGFLLPALLLNTAGIFIFLKKGAKHNNDNK